MELLQDLTADGAIWEEGPYKDLPTLAIVEGGGFRYLLGDFPIAAKVWADAYAIRADGVLTPSAYHPAEVVNNLPVTNGMIQPPIAPSLDAAPSSPFVHLHAHSEMSPLDGLATIKEMVAAVVANGQQALALTDHGVAAGHIELQTECRKAGIKPIFGEEAYLVNDVSIRTPETMYDYWHLVLLAKNGRGLRNLWQASSMAHLEGFYSKPRMDWDLLKETAEGVIATTACLRGPLADLILEGDETGARQQIARMQGIWGDDLYVEIHVNQLEKQIELNKGLVEIAQSMSLPMIAVGDSHYACADEKGTHQAWIAVQTDKTLQDEGDLFAGGQDYHLHSEDEVRAALSYLPESIVEECIQNTRHIADSVDTSIEGQVGNPVYHRAPEPSRDVQGEELDRQVLAELCEAAWDRRVGSRPDQDIYRERLAYELDLIQSKLFSGYLLVVWDYCNWCRDKRILLGPARGSSAGSLVCYLLGITQVDPIRYGLMFERFINPGRDELPDIDTDFPSSKRDDVTQYLSDRWGADHVVRVGTILRLKNKSVIRDVATILKGSMHEVEWDHVTKICKIIDEAESDTAGLGMSWDDLMAQEEDRLAEYIKMYPRLWELAPALVGRLKSYGKHPAGIVINTMEAIADKLPLRRGSGDQPTTEFPMDALTDLNFVKFDILTTRTLDTIQDTIDLIAEDPNVPNAPWPHDWDVEYDDPQVWEQLCEGDTLGVFQVETSAGTRMIDRYKPHDIDGMAAVLTLVRPGPDRSGLTDAYIRRRDGDEPVSYVLPELEPVLDKSYGTMIYQEEVMKVFQVVAGYSLVEADEVRSILGKKKKDKIPAERQKWEYRCAEMGVDPAISNRLFDQIQEFALYSFNKAHAVSYAMMSVWCAWLKTHYPLHFYVASLSTVKKERIPDFVSHARSQGYGIYPPDVNESGMVFKISADRMGVRYGFSSIPKVGEAAAMGVIEEQPYHGWEDFVERRGKKCNWGHIKTLSHVGTFDSLIPEDHHRADLEELIGRMSEGKVERCAWMKDGVVSTNPNVASCTFDWSQDIQIGKSGKPLKARPLPKKCTKACRRYEAVSAVEFRDNPALTPKEIRDRERDLLGLYLSSTPFDTLNMDALEHVTAVEIDRADSGHYMVIGEVQGLSTKKDSMERQMAFLNLLTPDGVLRSVIFSSVWRDLKGLCKEGTLAVFSVEKTNRGTNIKKLYPIETE